MNIELLRKHIKEYHKRITEDPITFDRETKERLERSSYYRSWTAERLKTISEEEFRAYISRLWAMLIWGNKQYAVDKLIENNGFENIKASLADLVWADASIEKRWDQFRAKVKGMGPAMMSEILCHVHSDECMLWNRRAYVGLNYLGVSELPRYDYQLTGRKYRELSGVAKKIASEMAGLGIQETNLLSVDYFIWHELQVEENLSQIHRKELESNDVSEVEKVDIQTAEFIHDEIRDKLSAVGQWLGFITRTEVKVAEGSKVDAIWEATIGNMGRVIYVFEVQTKGSIDSLIINLLKSLNNPAVQGVVAVSDAPQLDRIRKHAAGVGALREKLKYWDYKEVLQVHEALESVNEAINSLGLVPQGF
jgi:hypothetical protein